MKRKILSGYRLLLISFIVGCLSCDIADIEEVSREKSPDSIVEAVLVRTDAGATTAYGYLLYIVPAGEKPIEGRELLRADHMNGLEIRWKEVKFLEIEYKKGRIFHFSNFWNSEYVNNYDYTVELRLIPLSESFSLK